MSGFYASNPRSTPANKPAELQKSAPNRDLGTPAQSPGGRHIGGNVDGAALLFDEEGCATEGLLTALHALPLLDQQRRRHALDGVQRRLPLSRVEDLLQSAFYRPHEAFFSFQVNEKGTPPSSDQLASFASLHFVERLTIPRGSRYDVAVVVGGLLGAMDGRTSHLLQQGASFSAVALLGGQRPLNAQHEDRENILQYIGQKHFDEIAATKALPATEAELLSIVWEFYCRRNEQLRTLPVIEISSALRIGSAKAAPGTPETITDLFNSLVDRGPIPGLAAAPSTFLLSSSQPHAVRQRADFIAAAGGVSYPASQVDVIAFPKTEPLTIDLLGTELAKFVHAVFIHQKLLAEGAAQEEPVR